MTLIIRSSLVIDHIQKNLETQSQAMAFFYFDYQMPEMQTEGAFTASLLRQLLSQLSAFPESLRLLYDEHRDEEARGLSSELSAILIETAALFDSCYFIIDAIDECLNVSDRKAIVHVLAQLQSPGNRIFVTGRPYCALGFHAFQDCQTLPIEARTDDVRAYCDSAIDTSDLTTELLDGDLRRQVLDSIADHAQGM